MVSGSRVGTADSKQAIFSAPVIEALPSFWMCVLIDIADALDDFGYAGSRFIWLIYLLALNASSKHFILANKISNAGGATLNISACIAT